jgi:hypothetical protein
MQRGPPRPGRVRWVQVGLDDPAHQRLRQRGRVQVIEQPPQRAHQSRPEQLRRADPVQTSSASSVCLSAGNMPAIFGRGWMVENVIYRTPGCLGPGWPVTETDDYLWALRPGPPAALCRAYVVQLHRLVEE